MGVKKIVPDDETLADAYRRMRRQAIVQERIDELLKDLEDDDDELEVPDDLRAKIEECHAKRPHLRWDAVVHISPVTRPSLMMKRARRSEWTHQGGAVFAL